MTELYFDPANTNVAMTLSDSNKVTTVNTGAAFPPAKGGTSTTGKGYFEVECTTIVVDAFGSWYLSIAKAAVGKNANYYASNDVWNWSGGGDYIHFTGISAGKATFAQGDVLMCAIDVSAHKVWFGKNGSWNEGDPAAGTSPAYTDSDIETEMFPAVNGGRLTNDSVKLRVKSAEFSHAPPAGFHGIGDGTFINAPMGEVGISGENPAIAGTGRIIPFMTEIDFTAGGVPAFVVTPPAADMAISAYNPAIAGSGRIIPFMTDIDIAGVTPKLTQSINAPNDLTISAYNPAIAGSGRIIPLMAKVDFITTAGLSVSVNSPLVSLSITGTATVQNEIPIPLLDIGIEGYPPEIQTYKINLNNAFLIYKFYLDGIEIPIESFQSRVRTELPTYLSVNIPGIEYASTITAHSTGVMSVKVGYVKDDVIYSLTPIVVADLEDIVVHEGPSSKSIELSGHRTETHSNKTVTVTNINYKKTDGSNITLRSVVPNFDLAPGDTVIDHDGYSFVAGKIVFTMSAGYSNMEIYSEAA